MQLLLLDGLGASANQPKPPVLRHYLPRLPRVPGPRHVLASPFPNLYAPPAIQYILIYPLPSLGLQHIPFAGLTRATLIHGQLLHIIALLLSALWPPQGAHTYHTSYTTYHIHIYIFTRSLRHIHISYSMYHIACIIHHTYISGAWYHNSSYVPGPHVIITHPLTPARMSRARLTPLPAGQDRYSPLCVHIHHIIQHELTIAHWPFIIHLGHGAFYWYSLEIRMGNYWYSLDWALGQTHPSQPKSLQPSRIVCPACRAKPDRVTSGKTLLIFPAAR
jgi:hypothetical protein